MSLVFPLVNTEHWAKESASYLLLGVHLLRVCHITLPPSYCAFPIRQAMLYLASVIIVNIGEDKPFPASHIWPFAQPPKSFVLMFRVSISSSVLPWRKARSPSVTQCGPIRRCAGWRCSRRRRCSILKRRWPPWLQRDTVNLKRWVSSAVSLLCCAPAAHYHESPSFQQCPGCKTNVERKDLTNLCVQCTICKSDKKETCQFCWQCLKPWKGRAPRSDRCDNADCINRDLELLKNCKLVALPQVQGVTACPSIRACPTCGMKVEHDKTGCKNIICPRCHKEFCFVCLKLTPQCLKTSSYFIPCSDSVAPRQTSIPVWRRKWKIIPSNDNYQGSL